MKADNTEFIIDIEVLDRLADKRVYLYGIQDGQVFYERYSSAISIIGFIDNYYSEDTFLGLRVFSVNTIPQLNPNDVIIICSCNYSFFMKESLDKKGFRSTVDYYIWDKNYTPMLERLIAWNKKTWKPDDVHPGDNGECIIELNNYKSIDTCAVVYGYIVDYLQTKYNCPVKVRVLRDGTENRILPTPSVLETYSSFGAKEVINVDYEQYKAEIDDYYTEIVNGIHKLEDWNNITIYDHNYGPSIIRNYIRTYTLSFDPLSEGFLTALRDSISDVVFWKHYFDDHKVNCIVFIDAVNHSCFIREEAYRIGIPSYVVEAAACGAKKVNAKDFNNGDYYPYLHSFYDELNPNEKTVGIKWAKDCMEKALQGDSTVTPYRYDCSMNHYCSDSKLTIRSEGNKVKVLICPHIFEEDPLYNGYQLFDNNFLSWLEFIGNMSDELDYDWYLKKHPDERSRGNRLIDSFLEQHPKIKLLPTKISAKDLQESGINYALTVAGSIGHEYPLLGINVVNAGNNPHMSFDFTINPSSKEEYEEILRDLESYDRLGNIEEIFQYYCVDWKYLQTGHRKLIKEYFLDRWIYKNEKGKFVYDFDRFIEMMDEDIHDQIRENTVHLFEEMDDYDERVFYRK